MTIQKQTYLNEILVRLRRDGSISGAHQVHNEILVDADTGEVLSERAGMAQPLDADEVGSIVGHSFAGAAAQVARLEAQVMQMTQERDARPASPIATGAAVISDRQFFQGLALRGLCTPGEALEAVRAGVLPPALRAFVDAIEDREERWAAEMLMAGAKEFRRDHAFVAAVGAWAGLDASALDEFWAQCAAL
ncbi:MAG: hypothetical protein K2Y29_12860 [Beijerinckiaceae bacterium]|nr:hypothetical protein [Beijerinckiaceae bacterium]